MIGKMLANRMVVIAVMLFGAMLLVACTSSAATEEDLQQAFAEYHSSPDAQELRAAEVTKLLDEQPIEEEFSRLYNADSLKTQRNSEHTEWHEANQPSEKDRIQSFTDLYDLFTEDRQTEAQEAFGELIFDGEHEGPSLVLKLAGVDAEKEVLRFVRQVFVEVWFVDTYENALREFGIEPTDPKEEKTLPSVFEALPDKMVRAPGDLLGLGGPPFIGNLGQEHVMLADSAYVSICTTVSRWEALDNFTVTFTVRPNTNEGNWKKETLFNGTARELCQESASSPRHDVDRQTVFFKRPELTVFPVPSNPLRIASPDDLKPGGFLLFPTTTENSGLRLAWGLLEGVRKFQEFGPSFLEFQGVPATAPSQDDVMGPLYYVTGNKDEPVMLVGYIISADFPTSAAVWAGKFLDGVKEFPFVVVKD